MNTKEYQLVILKIVLRASHFDILFIQMSLNTREYVVRQGVYMIWCFCCPAVINVGRVNFQ